MKIYKIKADGGKCQWVSPADKGLFSSGEMLFDGVPKAARWGRPRFYVQSPMLPRANFFMGISGALIFDQKVMDQPVVYMHLEMAGEILPIELETGEELFILNVTEVTNSLDQSRTTFRRDPMTKQPTGVIDYVFYPDRMVASSIFKIPETRRAEVLTFADKNSCPEDEFYHAYLNSGLTGLRFEPLWTSDD